MKTLKLPITLLLIIGLLVVVLYVTFDETLPQGIPGEKADELALKMLASVENEGWKKTGAVQWEFSRSGVLHKHIWDKDRHYAQVEFEGNLVQIDINKRKGVVLNNSDMSMFKKVELCEKAWKYWVNDSFWLNPISKVFDPDTSRKIVVNNNDMPSLLITYNSGGTTPGDSYLWILDKNHTPLAWKLWVSIIPIGGLEFSWDGWVKLSTGAKVATKHRGVTDIFINNVRGKTTLAGLTGGRDIFSELDKSEIGF